MRKVLLSMLLVCVTVFAAFAQKTISGSVADEDGPLVGVSILAVGTTQGALTDLDGNFSFTIPEGVETIEVTYIGYAKQTFNVADLTNGQNLKITMKIEDDLLNEVVISASKKKERVLDAPASVTVITAASLEKNSAVTATDHIKKVPGVDVMQTGLVSANVNIRGFNNIFSGAMLTMVDYRIARVPSLRVNAFQLIPSNNHDIDKIEVVRGPASALYGPNAADGVFHIITKSPLDLTDRNHETTVSFTGGSRSLWKPEIRHVSKINDKLGIKVSGSYMQGHDWLFYDDREPAIGDTLVFGNVFQGGLFQEDTTIPREAFNRDFFIQNFNVDGRLDYKLNSDIDFTFAGGIARTTNLELTGLGAAQGNGWKYYYAQTRMRWKELYVQYFFNQSNSGETFLIPQVSGSGPHNVSFLVDKSSIHVVTAQHRTELNKLELIYGADFLATRPNSENTIYGRFDDSSGINQVGVYAQAEYEIIPQLSAVGAMRFDYQDVISEPQVSPRVALVYKPNNNHTIRGTYNRAFNSPTALNYFLDLANGQIPNGINIRGIGNPNGYNYNFDENGVPRFFSPYDQQWYDFNDKTQNATHFNNMMQIVAGGLEAQAPDNIKPLVPIALGILLGGISEPGSGSINGVDQVAVDYLRILETGSTTLSEVGTDRYQDKDAIKSTITQTFEIGYKGILADKLFLTADFWYSKIDNFSSPLTNISGSVAFDEQQLAAILTDGTMAANLNTPNPLIPGGGSLNDILWPLLESNPDFVVEANQDAFDELLAIILGGNAGLTAGSITPDNALVGSDVILTYFNAGEIDIAGIDIGFKYLVTDEISVAGALSHLNKDRIKIPEVEDFFIYLNSPRWRTAVSVEYENKRYGFGARIGHRWQDGFYGSSAIYEGFVNPANLIDLGVSYRPTMIDGLLFSVDITNLANYKFSQFPGLPEIGIMALAKVQYTFGR